MQSNPLPTEFPPSPPADGDGRILRIRQHLRVKCALRKSPYCDWIIALRLQGVTYPQLSRWLFERDYGMPIATLCVNLKNIAVPNRTREADAIGGRFGTDEEAELEGQIAMLRGRIDKMHNYEKARQAGSPGNPKANPPIPAMAPEPGYYHPRIERTSEIMQNAIVNLATLRERAAERAASESPKDKKTLQNAISAEAMDVIRGLYLTGQIRLLDDVDTTVAPKEVHEGEKKPELLN